MTKLRVNVIAPELVAADRSRLNVAPGRYVVAANGADGLRAGVITLTIR